MDGKANKPGEAKPGEAKPGEVLKTGGEASAAAYAEVDVPEATDCPTIEVDRVRVVPPSRTPTVKIADRAKRAGPRAPDQMVMPKPKGAVELPEGRPVTKMQVIEIDPEFLLELEKGREQERAGTAEAGAAAGSMDSPWVKEAPARLRAAELPSAGGPPSAPVSAAVREKQPARGAVLLVAAVLVTALVVAVAATRGPRGREKAAASAAATSTATAASTTAEPPPSMAPSAAAVPPPSMVPSVAATSSAPSPRGIRPAGKPTSDGGDPYGPAATPIPPKTTADPLPPAPPTTASASALPKPSASPWGGNATEF